MSRLDEVVHFFETLSPQAVTEFGRYYAQDARFIDPFNDVRGLAAIQAVFAHMYAQVEAPAFTVLERFERGEQAMLIWRFSARAGGRPVLFEGSTQLVFDAGGMVCLHRDFWDAASQLYEQLPIFGALVRCARRRLAAPPPDTP